MQHIQEISRHQLQMSSLEEKITAENPVFIEAFVNHIDAIKVGFKSNVLKPEGRPSFSTAVFLKLYIYSYLHGVRSSLHLGKSFFRNIKLQWSIEDFRPNYYNF